MGVVKTVIVIGPGGAVGRVAIKHLIASGFEVSGLVRQSSKTDVPAGVRLFRTDYSLQSLQDAFKGQDAVISTINGDGLQVQKTIVDAAISAGVKIFFPSEFGIDTSDPNAAKIIPFLKAKVELLDYLQTKEEKLSWTSIVINSLFDWGLDVPSFGGLNIPARSAVIYDGGDVPYEVTSLDQTGRAVSASLLQPEATRNQHVYVNSFTITQNQLIQALEKATGDKFTLSHDSVSNLRAAGFKQLESGDAMGMLALVASAFYGNFGTANYSKTKGLWNDKLGLPKEGLESFCQEYVASKR
jgi:nucleoside-diphosphate-sugar epimerase